MNVEQLDNKSFSVAPHWRYTSTGQFINPYVKDKTPYSTKQGTPERTSTSTSHRIKFQLREKAAFVIMRRKGLSINQIAEFWGRSTSVIYRVLKSAMNRTVCGWADLRKSPRKARLRIASFMGAKLESLRSQWEQFVLGESGEPP